MQKFEFSTVKDFDNHISSSIHGYDLLHTLILNISSFFIKPYTKPVDLGCTTGKLLHEVSKRYNVSCIGFDILDDNFSKKGKGNVDLLKKDITSESFEVPRTDLIYSVFTLQFLEINKRAPLLRKCHEALNTNGALIICEKDLSEDGAVQEVFTFSNYQYKREKFTEAQILEKEQKLRHTMTNLTSKENIKMFKTAGFKAIEPFFQSLNFKGYILKK